MCRATHLTKTFLSFPDLEHATGGVCSRVAPVWGRQLLNSMSSTFIKCATRFCKGLLVSRKLYHSPYCSRCRSRRWRTAHPIEAAFHTLKHHAKARGIEFTITLEYFRNFCNITGYIEQRGKSSTSAQVDRIEEHKGYIEGNLQILTNAQNTRKRYVPFWRDQAEKEALIKEAERKVKEAYPEHI